MTVMQQQYILNALNICKVADDWQDQHRVLSDVRSYLRSALEACEDVEIELDKGRWVLRQAE